MVKSCIFNLCSCFTVFGVLGFFGSKLASYIKEENCKCSEMPERFRISTSSEGDTFRECAEILLERYRIIKNLADVQEVRMICDGDSDLTIWQIKQTCLDVFKDSGLDKISFGISEENETEGQAKLTLCFETTDKDSIEEIKNCNLSGEISIDVQ